jgi:hypothetical protein
MMSDEAKKRVLRSRPLATRILLPLLLGMILAFVFVDFQWRYLIRYTPGFFYSLGSLLAFIFISIGAVFCFRHSLMRKNLKSLLLLIMYISFIFIGYAFLTGYFYNYFRIHPTYSPPHPVILLFSILIMSVIISYLLLIKSPFFGYIRPILALSGRRVRDTQDGYTDRPYPAGKFRFPIDELKPFADELKSYAIGNADFSQDKIIFFFSNSFRMDNDFSEISLQNRTHIDFDPDGNMTVFIPKKDYEKYKKQLSFDQLCQNLGELFMEFFAMYKEGKMKEVVKMLKKAAD